MKSKRKNIALIAALMLNAELIFAQSGGSNNILLISTLLVAALIVLSVVLQVSDNLLVIEAKQRGVAEKGNFSLFPRFSDLVPTKKPKYAEEGNVHFLRRGFDIKLRGEANADVKEGNAKTYAVQPPNFNGIAPIPKLLVEEGDEVKAGDPLFFDKSNPDIKYVSPVSGEVIAINRGAKRSIAEVVILADKEMKYRSVPAFDLEGGNREALVAHLMEYGAWPLFRQRPFNIVADANEVPANIFVSTFDTAPLAPDMSLVVAGREADFQRGLDVLNKLTEGRVYLGLDASRDDAPSTAFTGAEGVEKHWFKGKHPAGNVGVQIHHIAPVTSDRKVWTLGVQEVITLGSLFSQQRFDASRVVVVAGNEVENPHYVRTYLGANVGDLIEGNLTKENVRTISGNVLSGEQKAKESFLNFYDSQLSVVEEGDYYEPFGWLLPIKPRPSASRTFPNFLLPGYKFKADTNTHGEPRAFVVTGQYEKVLPMDVYPQHLMKSILVNDFERMEGLGIYELVEEDIALCEFVCTSKQPLQKILREGLDMMYEQG
jgi:Na+-transporting NADH:ubiquinone oxidoreductase subunit A